MFHNTPQTKTIRIQDRISKLHVSVATPSLNFMPDLEGDVRALT